MNNNEMWLPTKIDYIKNNFVFDSTDTLKKNIAYNIQYTQYLIRDISTNKYTSVLNKMRYKTFVITSISIIEAVFYALLKARNLIPLEEWKEVGDHKHQHVDDNTFYTIIKKRKVTPFEKNIRFDEAISLVEKNNVLGFSKKAYEILRYLQNLRNHLHLNKAKEISQSDYNYFNEAVFFAMKMALYYTLSNKNVSMEKNYLKYLK